RARTPLPVRLAAEAFLPELQRWDRATAQSVDEFVAISHYIAERIDRIYGRSSRVIYPPVDCGRFAIAEPSMVGEHYLMVTALAPYKGVDLAIRAFNRLGKKLVIIGSGQDERRVRAMAGPTIEFRGWIDDESVTRSYREARAFLLPCDEDFGITPLESMASGRPVIALGRGGALETVVAGETGLFFPEREVDALCAAIETMEREHDRFDPARLRDHAWSFDVARFRAEVAALFEEYGAKVPVADRAAARPLSPNNPPTPSA
ncbi:MAG: glycosyltransferase, partial [Planctomycetota bacterium]